MSDDKRPPAPAARPEPADLVGKVTSEEERGVVGLDHATTESVDERLAEIDLMPTDELAALMNELDREVPLAVGRATGAIAALVDDIVPGLRRGGRIIYAGAGTAGRLGVLDASECPPTFNTDPREVVGLIAGGTTALTTAVEGAEDDPAAGARDVADLGVGPDDAVIGISASGRTPYAVGAVEEAARRGAITGGIACNEGSALARAALHPIEVIVGPELIAGSTRLRAGTAQKLTLNMISTLAMIRLGKTYGNLMVDVRASNIKLRDRVHRIVAHATGADPADIDRAIEACGGHAKTAIVMLRADVDADVARAALAEDDGVLRRSLERATELKGR